jgi:uncharacterized membrane protein
MSAATDRFSTNANGNRIGALRAILLGSLALLAATFFLYYVPHYLLQYDKASYDVYWPRRFGLLPHIFGGTLALFVGPLQFWTGLRRQYPTFHRWTGRVFLLGVSIGVCGAVYLAFTTTYGWAYGSGLLGLATAWVATSGMAYYAIRSGDIQTHKLWMIRAYTVTFAFATARLFDDWLPLPQSGESIRLVNDVWLSWSIPLLAVVVIQSVIEVHARKAKPATP